MTVLSRRAVQPETPAGGADRRAHALNILEAEGIVFEPAGLRLIAQAADGSVRDALSLLDQLIAFGGGRRAGEAEARAMLGIDRPRPGGAPRRASGGL